SPWAALSERLDEIGPAAGRGDRPETALHLPLERRHRPGLRRGHHRVGAGGVRAPGVLAQLQVPPAARPAHRELPRPRLFLPGRRRAERARRAPPGRTGHGRALPEHLALAGLRRQGGQPAGRPVPRPRLYYKTFIKPQRLWPLYERVLHRFTHSGYISADTPRTE